jgi:hypothetical protein
MDNTKQLPSKKPDFYVKVTLSSFEAALIMKLRKYDWGTFVIQKQNGQPRKCDVQESDFLKESDGIALELINEEFEQKLLNPDKNKS